MSDQNLVELRALRKSFGDNLVLDGVDLSVARGEVIVIAGPSGSGKSTMLRCVNGLETPDSGEILFDGRPVKPGKALPGIRAEIGLVFQQFNLFPHMTVLDNITLAPIKVKGLPKREADVRPVLYGSASAFQKKPMRTPPSSREGSSSAWPLHARWRWTRS